MGSIFSLIALQTVRSSMSPLNLDRGPDQEKADQSRAALGHSASSRDAVAPRLLGRIFLIASVEDNKGYAVHCLNSAGYAFNTRMLATLMGQGPSRVQIFCNGTLAKKERRLMS